MIMRSGTVMWSVTGPSADTDVRNCVDVRLQSGKSIRARNLFEVRNCPEDRNCVEDKNFVKVLYGEARSFLV
jgi:hypothetical protein